VETGTCSHDPAHTTTRPVAALGHDFTGAWIHDDTHHWKECARTPGVISGNGVEESAKALHSFVGGVCSICERTQDLPTVVITVPSLDHPTLADAIAAVPPGATATIRLEEDIIIPSAIAVDGKEITIVSQSGTTTISLGENGNMFAVGSGGNLILGDTTSNKLTLEGINGNTNSLIRVTSGGTLEMNDSAVITGNVLPDSNTTGAGVNVNGGVFNMNGGKITDCTANNGGAIRINAGTATISGSSEISGNTSTYGGAISITTAILTIEGDVTIHSNTVTVSGGAISMNGAAGTVNMRGGSIYNNTAGNSGGGVYVQAGTFNFYGGIIYGTDGETHSPPREPNKSAATSAALSRPSGGTAQYGDGEPITTTNDTIVGRQ